MEDKLDEILNSLKLETTQQTYPPYTETNKPQGIISISGKEEANRALQSLINSAVREARIHELEMVIGIDEVWAAPETKREHHKQRLAELKGTIEQ